MGSFNGAGSSVGLVPGISETIALADAAGMLAEFLSVLNCCYAREREVTQGNSSVLKLSSLHL